MIKVMRLGTIDVGHRVSIYFRIDDTRGYWSFTGVIGPRPSGNALCCGQIVGAFQPEDVQFANGWDRSKLLRFVYVWRKYHLTSAIPQKVVDFLVDLPVTDKTPAWI